jgi:hypothetical protein
MAGSCEHGSEPVGFIKCGIFLEFWIVFVIVLTGLNWFIYVYSVSGSELD